MISDGVGHAAVEKKRKEKQISSSSSRSSSKKKKKKKKKSKIFNQENRNKGVRGKIDEKLNELSEGSQARGDKLVKQFKDKLNKVKKEQARENLTKTTETLTTTTDTPITTSTRSTTTNVPSTTTTRVTTTSTTAFSASETIVATTAASVSKTTARPSVEKRSPANVPTPKIATVIEEEDRPNVVDIMMNDKNDKRLRRKTSNVEGDNRPAERSKDAPVKLIEAKFKTLPVDMPPQTEDPTEVKKREQNLKKEREMNSDEGTLKYLARQKELELEKKRLEEQLEELVAKNKRAQEMQQEKMRKQLEEMHKKSLESSAAEENERARKMKEMQDWRMGKNKMEEEEKLRLGASVAMGDDKVRIYPGGAPIYKPEAPAPVPPMPPASDEEDEAPAIPRPKVVMAFTQPPRMTPKPKTAEEIRAEAEAKMKHLFRTQEDQMELQRAHQSNLMAEMMKEQIAEQELRKQRFAHAEKQHELANALRLGQSVKERKQNGFDPEHPW